MSSSGQLRSMSGLVDLGIKVYCCGISDFKGTLLLKSTTEFYCQGQAQVQVSLALSLALDYNLVMIWS